MNIGVVSDVGKVRELNEDNYSIETGDIKLFIVADGMGGHNAGEVASQLAIDKIKEHILKYLPQEQEEEQIKGIIYEAFIRANREIFNKAKAESECDGMGTTATAAVIIDDRVYIGHVGDSRAYLISDGVIEQITLDHSLVAELLRKGSISEREAMQHPQKNVITRALGTDENVKPDIYSIEFNEADYLVLCTDGLSNFVDRYELERYILEIEDCQNCCNYLVDIANQRGGFDNITLIIVKNNMIEIEGR